jgi:hypothetical protein
LSARQSSLLVARPLIALCVAEPFLEVTATQGAELERRRAEREWTWYEEAAAEGDYLAALSRLSSTEVARAIVEIDREHEPTTAELRAILSDHWTRCDAPRDAVDGLLAAFRRAGYASDTESRPRGLLTIYRGTVRRRSARWYLVDA